MRRIVLALALLWLLPTTVSAATYYVDGSCANNGTGLADQCAASGGAPGAYLDPQSCFSAVTAGDTCLIKNGTYITTFDGERFDEGFRVVNSGTVGSPIVIKNYPGHSPLLANCPVAQTTWCPRPTITAVNQAYITFDGLRVHGAYYLASFGAGYVIKNSEVTGGFEDPDDGNWAGIRLEHQVFALIQNNYIHDISALTGSGWQGSAGCIKFYHVFDSLVEHNTCHTITIDDENAAAIDDKAEATRNIHRYNWIENVPNNCFRVNNQSPSTGVQIYGNVCISGGSVGAGTRYLDLIDGIDVYNNLFVAFDSGQYGGGQTNFRMYNNIYHNIVGLNMEFYFDPIALSNYNRFTAGRSYTYDFANWGSLSAYSSATGFDTNSTEGDCQFVNAAAKDFHLQVGSPCRNAGRVGGVSGGAVVDLGPYAVTSCVGHTCGGKTGNQTKVPFIRR